MAAKTRLGVGGSAKAYPTFTAKRPNDGSAGAGGGMRIIELRRRKS